MDNNIDTETIQPIDLYDINFQSDKELLEDFLNSIELDDSKYTDLESITPEIRLNNFLWVLKLKEAEIEKCNSIAEGNIERTNNWLDTKHKKINSTIDFLSNQMRQYLSSQKLKSLSLPNGTIGLRKQPDSVIVTDEGLFLSVAKPELLRHLTESYEPDLKAIKDYLKNTGELPDGCELKSKSDKFYYKLETD